MSLEITQLESSFDGQKLLRLYKKRNEPSSAKIKKMKQHRAKLTGGKQFYRAFLPRFNTCVSCLCSMPTEQDLGRGPHMGEFSRKCMMINREVLGRNWLPSSQRLNQDGGGGDIENRIWGGIFSFLTIVKVRCSTHCESRNLLLTIKVSFHKQMIKNIWLLFMFGLRQSAKRNETKRNKTKRNLLHVQELTSINGTKNYSLPRKLPSPDRLFLVIDETRLANYFQKRSSKVIWLDTAYR